LQLLLLLLDRGIRETFNSLILMLLIILTGTTEMEDGREATQIAVPEGQFDNGSGTLATIETETLVTTGFIWASRKYCYGLW
jgi:hypothetical protein